MNLFSTTFAFVFIQVNSYIPKYSNNLKKRFQVRLFSNNLKKVVFLGTPVVAANCLKVLFESSQLDGYVFYRLFFEQLVSVTLIPFKGQGLHCLQL